MSAPAKYWNIGTIGTPPCRDLAVTSQVNKYLLILYRFRPFRLRDTPPFQSFQSFQYRPKWSECSNPPAPVLAGR